MVSGNICGREMARSANSGFTLDIYSIVHNKKKNVCTIFHITILFLHEKMFKETCTRRTETPIILSDQSFLDCDTMYCLIGKE